MIALWMLYLTAVATLLALTAWMLERTAARQGWPLRWPWCAGLVGSFLLPLATAWNSRPTRDGAPAGSIQLGPVELAGTLPNVSRAWSAGVADRLAPLDGPLLAIWVVGAAAVLTFLLVSAARLRRERRSWSTANVSGRKVLLSTDTGPAVVGLIRPVVVLPRWALELEPSRKELLLAHEQEHLRARDPWLLLSGLGLLVLMPWNPLLWWQTHRLRLAIEVDCDARVLRRIPQLRPYALLLLELGARRSRLPFAVAAFAEPPSFLERRLLMMTRPPSRSWMVVLVAGTFSALVTLVACSLDQPESVTATLPGSQPPPAVDATVPAASPTPSEFTEPPSVINREEIGRLLGEAYPSLLRDAGIGGRVELWLFIAESGVVQETRLAKTSGHQALDEAAQEVARGMRFSPARNEGRPVGAWIQLPITFQTTERSAEPAGAATTRNQQTALSDPASVAAVKITTPAGTSTVEAAPTPAFSPRREEAGPRFTPRDVEPSLLNRTEFSRALEESYPAELRAAGRGGSVILWVYLSSSGKVTDARVTRSSGEPALDEAALTAIRRAEFSPAMLKDAPIDVWIQLPVTFRP